MNKALVWGNDTKCVLMHISRWEWFLLQLLQSHLLANIQSELYRAENIFHLCKTLHNIQGTNSFLTLAKRKWC